jgi:hypothetical protein
VHLSNDKVFTRRNIMSSSAQKAVHSIMRSSDEAGTPKRASSTQEIRGAKESGRGEKERALELRRHNPLVIYPFASKLKVRRVDDNPRIMGNLIRKKLKEMGEEEVFEYINGLVHR